MVEPAVLWRPEPASANRSNLARFAARCGDETGVDLGSYDDLWAWSIADLGRFWSAVAGDAGVHWHDAPSGSLDRAAMPGTSWFPRGTLSYAEQVLRAGSDRLEQVAILSFSQTRPKESWTWARLLDEVGRIRAGLEGLGVRRGDRVAAYLPNLPETVAALLATASLGAIWVSCAPEFGPDGVVDRFAQVDPVVLLAVDGYRYGAKDIDRRAEIAAIRAQLPSLRQVVHLPYLHGVPLADSMSWAELRSNGEEPLSHQAVPFDHPLYVLFSSGTTGRPKPIVHRTGGIVLEHWKALALHHDLGPNSRFFWFTTTGWMMWNYLVSGLMTGAAIVTFDGDPAEPDLGELWRTAGESSATVFGTSAPFLLACRRSGVAPLEEADLSALTQVGSTGAPLGAEGFTWVAEHLPGRQLNSISGGTDVCTAFVGMNPLTPVWAGEISRPLLGVDAAAVLPDGALAPTGTQGELVIRSPMPSMPVGLWGDPDGVQLRAAYFDQHPGAWSHGDWVTFTERGSCVISGRSDATLNRGGVRIGTAEFYSVAESLPQVLDSLVVHLEATDELVLFVVVADPPFEEGVHQEIARALRTRLSPRHVPDRILPVASIPRTLTGKKLEVPIKRLLQGVPVDEAVSIGALADPTSLDPFVALARILVPPVG